MSLTSTWHITAPRLMAVTSAGRSLRHRVSSALLCWSGLLAGE
jgi:hypothetical protein